MDTVHENLCALERAGLAQYEVLSAATRVPGALINRSARSAAPFGTIAPGSRADLIYTAQNPLDDLSTLREPLGAILDEVARKYRESER